MPPALIPLDKWLLNIPLSKHLWRLSAGTMWTSLEAPLIPVHATLFWITPWRRQNMERPVQEECWCRHWWCLAERSLGGVHFPGIEQLPPTPSVELFSYDNSFGVTILNSSLPCLSSLHYLQAVCHASSGSISPEPLQWPCSGPCPEWLPHTATDLVTAWVQGSTPLVSGPASVHSGGSVSSLFESLLSERKSSCYSIVDVCLSQATGISAD